MSRWKSVRRPRLDDEPFSARPVLGSRRLQCREEQGRPADESSMIVEKGAGPIPGGESDPPVSQSSLRRLMEFVLDNLDRKITLQDAARVAGVERTYLSRLFREHTGQLFSEWIRDVRLACAEDLLLNTGLSEVFIHPLKGLNDGGLVWRGKFDDPVPVFQEIDGTDLITLIGTDPLTGLTENQCEMARLSPKLQ